LFTAADGQPNPAVLSAQMSGDGRTVVFHSAFNQLVPHDFNDKLDVFSIVLARDIDDDGLDDDWEVAHFGNLSRDGSGDYDMDGARDRDEFLATTDPTNGGSVFRVMALIPVNGGSRQVTWEGNPALTYRVEYKDDLNIPNWTTLSGTISWNGSTASIIDTSAGTSPNRFYRAVRLP